MKERNQNPAVNDVLTLRLVTFNSNNLSNLKSVVKVEIFPDNCSTDCTTLPVQSITDIMADDVGEYHVDVTLTSPLYTVGKYKDVWTVVFEEGGEPVTITNHFEVFPELWYTSTMPAVYGFDFQFQPNRIRMGSVKWLIIKIIPNVPRSTDLEKYYTNLAISSNLTVSMELSCGTCVPPESDLRLLVEDDLVTVRDKVFGYYKVDTTDDGPGFVCGVYNVWFTLKYAGSIDVSEKFQLLVF